jgi:hypothetical protein
VKLWAAVPPPTDKEDAMASPTTIAPPTAVRRRARATAVAAAVLAATAVWLLAVPLLGTELRVTQPGRPPQQVGLPVVVATALAASVAGWGLLAVLERLTRRARTVWTIAAVVVLALSLIAPLSATTTPAARAVLVLLHLAVGAVLVPGLRRSAAS